MADIDDNGWLDVSAQDRRVAYIATGGQTSFPVPFAFLADTELQVYINGVLKTLSTDYTTAGAGDEAGGTVTLVSGATGGDRVVVTGFLTLELTTHIPPSGPLDISAINEQFSRLVMMLQQIDAERVRAIKQPDADAAEMADLPAQSARALKFLYFNGNGDPTAVDVFATANPATPFILTLLDDTSAAEARATLGITDQSAYSGLSNSLFCI